MCKRLFDFDREICGSNKYLIGTDEAGRGPGAGPVVAAAVYFPEINNDLIKQLKYLNDSKKLNENQRARLFNVIVANSIYSVKFGGVKEIESTNILRASLKCMRNACCTVINNSKQINEEYIPYIIVDGNRKIPYINYEQDYIVQGDGKSASIAAASIVAKVVHDRYMINLGEKYPKYGWQKNKGYLTEEHIKAIEKYGVTPYHRWSFVRKFVEKQLTLW